MTTAATHTPPPPRPSADLDATRAASSLVVIAASMGGVAALETLIKALPADLPAAVVVVLHRPPRSTDLLPRILSVASALPVCVADPGQRPQAATVYVAPPHHHLVLTPARRFLLRDGRRVHGTLSAADPLLESAAVAYPGRVLAIVLTGYGTDASMGARCVAEAHGVVFAQDPATAVAGSMPRAAIATGSVNRILALPAMAAEITHVADLWEVDDRPTHKHRVR
jgi:two-component system chemotaxis response regulator CheB